MTKPIFKCDQNGSTTTVRISGDLNVRFHRELYSGFSAIPEQGDIAIVIQTPQSIDLFFSQLLHSFSRKMWEENRKLTIKSDFNPVDAQLLARAGLMSIYNL